MTTAFAYSLSRASTTALSCPAAAVAVVLTD